MKKVFVLTVLLVSALSMTGCAQTMTKSFGGTMTMDLSKGEKLVNITWKDDQLWYLTKPMSAEDNAETYEFKQSSNLGIMEGKVIIKEYK